MMIQMIGHRLTDPKEKMDEMMGIFPYAAEKEKVAEILKARTQTLNSQMFNKGGKALNTSGRGALGHGAGRGPAGRGPMGRPAPVPAGRGGYASTFTRSASIKPSFSAKVLAHLEETDESEESPKETPEELQKAQEIKSNIVAKRSADNVVSRRGSNGNYTTQTVSNPQDNVVAQLLMEKETRPMSMSVNGLARPRSSESLRKQSIAEKPPGVTEEQIQASAAILSAMFPQMSAGEPKISPIDPISKYLSLLGLDDEKSGQNRHSADFIYKHVEDHNVKAELALILKSMKLSTKDAVSMIDTDEWQKYLESQEVYVDEEHIQLEREIYAVCKALGISSIQAKRYSERLENWEEKVILEKIQRKDSDDHGIVLSAAKSKLYEDVSSEDTPSNRSLSDSFSVGTRSPTNSLDGIGSPPKPVGAQTYGSRADKYNRVKGLTNEEIIESLLQASRERRVTATLEKLAPSKPSQDKPMLANVPTRVNSNPPSPSPAIRRLSHENTTMKDKLGQDSPKPKEINPGIVRQRSMTFNGGVANNKFDEKAAPAAFSLNMDTNSFLQMQEEEPAGFDEVNQIPLYSFKELVRRNHCKQFNGLQHRELEKYLVDSEFQARFCMTKVIPKYSFVNENTDFSLMDRINLNHWRSGDR